MRKLAVAWLAVVFGLVFWSGLAATSAHAGFGAYSAAVQAHNPVAYWHLEENGGTAADSASSGSATDTGTYTGAFTAYQQPSVWPSIPVPNGGDTAPHFDLTGASYVTVADSADVRLGTGDFTISFWVKTDVAQRTVLLNKRVSSTSN